MKLKINFNIVFNLKFYFFKKLQILFSSVSTLFTLHARTHARMHARTYMYKKVKSQIQKI